MSRSSADCCLRGAKMLSEVEDSRFLNSFCARSMLESISRCAVSRATRAVNWFMVATIIPTAVLAFDSVSLIRLGDRGFT
jgi:hypothetical protein